VRTVGVVLLGFLVGAVAPAGAVPGFFAHLPVAGCTPAAPGVADREVTCAGGLDGNAPAGPEPHELSLSTTTADDGRRTATFRFSTVPFAARTVVAPGAGTAALFLHASGSGAPRTPVDVGVELHRQAGTSEAAFATGSLTQQVLPSGPGVVQRIDVPFTVSGPLLHRALEVGDRLVLVVTVVNRTSAAWKVFLDFDGALAPAATGPLPGCDGSGLADADGDGVPDVCDDCPLLANANQSDANGDGVGDSCQCLLPDRPGVCVPGGGPPATDCLTELLPAGVQLAAGPGGLAKAASCTDGDPACDADGVADGRCTLKLVLCVNNTDPRLACAPKSIGSLEVRTPSADRPKDATDASNALALEAAAQSLGVAIVRHRQIVTPGPGTSTLNACVPVAPPSFVVPLAKPHGSFAPTARRIALASIGSSSTGRSLRDSDRVKVTCVPGVATPSTTTTSTSTTTTTSTTTPAGCPPVGGSARPVVVQLATPPGATVAGATLLLDYPELQVTIPGSGGVPSVTGAIGGLPTGALATAFDLDTALRVAIASTGTLPVGPLFTVTFEDCTAAPTPQASDFVCTVSDAVDSLGTAVDGVTCSVTLP